MHMCANCTRFFSKNLTAPKGPWCSRPTCLNYKSNKSNCLPKRGVQKYIVPDLQLQSKLGLVRGAHEGGSRSVNSRVADLHDVSRFGISFIITV